MHELNFTCTSSCFYFHFHWEGSSLSLCSAVTGAQVTLSPKHFLENKLRSAFWNTSGSLCVTSARLPVLVLSFLSEQPDLRVNLMEGRKSENKVGRVSALCDQTPH